MIAAVSVGIERYLGRVVGQVTLDEIHYPDLRNGSLFLNEYPIQSVSRVAASRTPAISIENTSTSVNNIAMASLTTSGDIVNPTVTGLSLSRTASGVTSTSSLLFSTYLTLNTLSAAVNALGNGWSSRVGTGLGDWPTSELAREFGSKGATATFAAEFYIYSDIIGFDFVDFASGEVRMARPRGFRSPVRVTYIAGWPTASVPDPIKAAAIAWIKYVREGTNIGQYRQESLGDRSYELAQPFVTTFNQPPSLVATLLASYRQRRAV